MPITRATQAPSFELEGFHFLGFTAPSRGATELCTWRLDIEPGAESEAHRLDREEVFIVLEGTITVGLDEKEINLAVGDALAVPAQSLLQVGNRSDAPARALVCVSAGVRATFADGRELGTPPWAR